MIYFSSDYHFNNSLIYEYRKSTPSSENLFNNIGEMNRLMVKNVNENLKDGDILYILGDFGDFEYLSQFNPKVKYMIILGNHDDIADDEGEIPLKTLKKVIDYNDLNVEIITCANKDVILDKRYSALKKKYESIEILPILGGLFLLSHIPINNSKLLKYSITLHY